MTTELVAAWNHVRAFAWHKRGGSTWYTVARDIRLIRDACAAQEEHLAFTMRDAGCGWREIGEALGITRQAAMSRYAGPRSGDAK